MFDCHIYKDNHSLILQPDVHTDDQANVLVKSILLFGVTRNMKVGQAFESYEIMSKFFEVNLVEFPNGVKVILNQQPGGGRYYFTAENLS